MKPYPRGLKPHATPGTHDAGNRAALPSEPQPRSAQDAGTVHQESGAGARTFDARSESNIKTLIPEARQAARGFLAAVLAAGINAKIICGTRTYEEQDLLYAQGRTKGGHIVTKARGGYSWHNFGIAWDIGIFDGDKYVSESPLYARCGEIGCKLGLEWGGDWKTIVDEPHFQLKLGYDLAEARSRMVKGIALV